MRFGDAGTHTVLPGLTSGITRGTDLPRALVAAFFAAVPKP